MTADWRDHAACVYVDAELFFPEKGRIDMARAARRICAGCPVTAECLDWAQEHEKDYGVYGGLTPEERQRLRQGVAA